MNAYPSSAAKRSASTRHRPPPESPRDRVTTALIEDPSHVLGAARSSRRGRPALDRVISRHDRNRLLGIPGPSQIAAMMPTRRTVISAVIAAAACRSHPARAQEPPTSAPDTLAALEATHGGRLGVTAVDTGSGRTFGRRAGERFPMCSTYKVLTAAAVLARAEQGQLSLDQPVTYTQADLLTYAPVTRQNIGAGSMTVAALCAAAVGVSDNTAANLLLNLIGGPSGWTRYARSLGDETSRLDRAEPALNTAIPGDPRDTTTPAAMARNLNTLMFGAALTTPSRAQLENWMRDSRITATLLRAGLPRNWHVGDKSGSGDNGTRNDIGIIRRARCRPNHRRRLLYRFNPTTRRPGSRHRRSRPNHRHDIRTVTGEPRYRAPAVRPKRCRPQQAA